MIKALLAIAAAACLSLITVDAADRGDSDAGGPKHLKSSTHRASADVSRVGKASSSHTSHRSSMKARRSRDRQRTASNRDSIRSVNDSIQPDANVQVELPRRENENPSANEAEDNNKSGILVGGATDNDDGGGPRL